MHGFQQTGYLGIKVAKLFLEKIGNRLSNFFNWLAKGYEDNPPCKG